MPSRKQLLINMAANALAFIVQFGVSFLLTPYIVRTLGSEAYGFIPLVNTVTGYASIITVALDSISARFITIEITRGNIGRANKYFNSVLVADSAIAFILLIPATFVILDIRRVFNVPFHLLFDVKLTFAFAFLSLILNLIFAVFSCCYYVKNRVDLSARRGIWGNLIRAVVLVGLFSLLKPNIYYVSLTMLFVTLYLICWNIYYSQKLTPELKINLGKASWSTTRRMLSTGIWNSVNQLSSTLLTGLDLVLANIFLGAVQSGEYALVKTVPNFIIQLVIVVLSAFVPEFNILFAKGILDNLLKSIFFSLKVMGYLVTLPIGFLIVFGREFFQAWVSGQDVNLLQALSILTLLPLIVTCGTESIAKVFTVTNRLRVPAIFTILIGVLNILIVVLLIKFTSIGIWSIPITSGISTILIQMFFTPLYGAYCLKVPWFTFYRSIFRSMLCFVTVTGTCAVYRFIFQPEGWLQLILAGVISCMVALSINSVLVFDKVDRKKILEKLSIRISF